MNTQSSAQPHTRTRPPIVVVVGHIDHGKTTLLDTIRKTKVAEKESGGITQHIGAYEVEHHGKKITFIDTPGHEAFSKMRSRGTAAADIGILIVAADEGVKPQTKEAIAALLRANIPFLVAINKIDKAGANPERVKQELAQEQVLVESWGGKIPSIEISAKKGEHLNDLLDLILLVADIEHIEFHDTPAEGVVIESHRDSSRGNTATLLIRDGALAKTNTLLIGSSPESMKIFQNFAGHPITSASASMPVLVSGLSALPAVGDPFRSFSSRKEAEAAAQEKKEALSEHAPMKTEEEENKPTLYLILKTDVSGSKEALEGMIERITHPEVRISLLRSEVGDVSESDIKLAGVRPHTLIIAFKVRVPKPLKERAEREHVAVSEHDIIYNAERTIKEELSRLIPPVVERVDMGRAKVLALFKQNDLRQIIGGKVTGGHVSKGAFFDIERNKHVVGRGAIRELQHMKQAAGDVREGLEFGAMVESSEKLAEGDTLAVFEEKKTYSSL